jgi:hypothetical protein
MVRIYLALLLKKNKVLALLVGTYCLMTCLILGSLAKESLELFISDLIYISYNKDIERLTLRRGTKSLPLSRRERNERPYYLVSFFN